MTGVDVLGLAAIGGKHACGQGQVP